MNRYEIERFYHCLAQGKNNRHLRPKRKPVFSAKIEFIRENGAEATESQQ